jgi:hypothetical protein
MRDPVTSLLEQAEPRAPHRTTARPVVNRVVQAEPRLHEPAGTVSLLPEGSTTVSPGFVSVPVRQPGVTSVPVVRLPPELRVSDGAATVDGCVNVPRATPLGSRVGLAGAVTVGATRVTDGEPTTGLIES